jgi:hypothetical protein
MSNIRWYLNNDAIASLAEIGGEMWLNNEFCAGKVGDPSYQRKVEFKAEHPLSPSLDLFKDEIAELDGYARGVSFRGVARKVKLLQGEYFHQSLPGVATVYALPDGDYRIEITSEKFSGIQAVYHDLMKGKIEPDVVWRGVDKK